MRKVLFVLLAVALTAGAVDLVPLESGQWTAYDTNNGAMVFAIVELPGSDYLWFQIETETPEGDVVVQMAFNDAGVAFMEDSFSEMLSDPDSARENYRGLEDSLDEFTEYTEELRMAMTEPASGETYYLSMSKELFQQFGQMGAATMSPEQQSRIEESMAGLEWENAVAYTAAGHSFNCLRMITDISETYYSAEVPITGMVYMHSDPVDGSPEGEMELTGFGRSGAENAAAGLGEPVPFEVFMQEMMGESGGY